ncbi:hypothetical protein K505DRAFT_383285, partial [Melanomma pulvis-pyrius CBS 109.77]
YHFYTIWLFAYEQLFDTTIPCTIFGITGALSGKTLGFPSLPQAEILLHIPLVVIWLWILSLQFSLHNQRHPHSINEDSYNKPWRPLPSERITISGTNSILHFLYPIAGSLSYWLELLPHFGIFTILVIVYNDFGGSDHSGISRNILSGVIYACLLTGALQVAIGSENSLINGAYQWVRVIVLVFITTLHMTEFRDERGNRARGRRTIINVVGIRFARCTIAVGVIFWSFFAPLMLGIEWKGMIVPATLGGTVVGLIMIGMARNNTRLDGFLYKVYSIWILSLCPLPLVKSWTG